MIFWECLLDICGILMRAAATLPFLLLLGLAAGRRAHGRFCLNACESLGHFALLLTVSGFVYIPASYLLQMLSIGGNSYLATFFTRPAMHFSITLLLWLAASIILSLSLRALDKKRVNLYGASGLADRYALGELKSALWMLFCCIIFFALTFASSHWPFGGLPEGLSAERAIMAILRNTARSWFMALAPAGAMACVYAASRHFDPPYDKLAVRWCAIWAFIGYLPHCLQTWGILLGAGAHASAMQARQLGLLPQAASLILLTGGIICFAFVLFGKKSKRMTATLGLTLFLFAPVASRLCLAYTGN